MSRVTDKALKVALQKTKEYIGSRGFATSTDLDGKVDKVTGKGLSAEDFTTELKTKLESLGAYDDSELQGQIEALGTRLDTLVNGNASDAIDTFNEIETFLNGITNAESLTGLLNGLKTEIQKWVTDADMSEAEALNLAQEVFGQSVN